MEHLPIYISIIFVLTTIISLLLFYKAVKKSKVKSIQDKATIIFVLLMVWLIIQAVLSLNNIYNSNASVLPPKILILGLLPALVVIMLTFIFKRGKLFIDSLPLLNITYINTVRILVEIVLYLLLLNKVIPKQMTFEGINWDILAGITSPFIAYYGFIRLKISTRVVLGWNIISLILLINIVIIAILSSPTPLQKIGFDQPNIAILYFPFSWLPTFIVPLIIFGHLVSIRQLSKRKQITPPQS